VYWFPDTSDQFLASLRRTAYRYGVSLYSVAVRARLCQPTPELQPAEVENVKKWVDVAVKVGATHVRVFGGSIPKGATGNTGCGQKRSGRTDKIR
jgi:sugar phosphate isomerase/epimerase